MGVSKKWDKIVGRAVNNLINKMGLWQYIDEAEEEAMTALRNNRHILDRLVAELLEHSKLTGLVIFV